MAPDQVDLSGSCPSDQQLSDFAAGRLTPEETDRFAEHLDRCASCQDRLADLDEASEASIDGALPQEEAFPFAAEEQCRDAVQRVQRIAVDSGLSRKPPVRAASQAAQLQQVGDYELLERLGEGGMGAVFKARHRQLGTIVAVKLLHPQRTADRVAVERFQREMIAIGQLDHPNIVRAIDAGQEGDLYYLVMEFIDGVDLSRLARSRLQSATRRGAEDPTMGSRADSAQSASSSAPAARLDIADACELIRQAAVGLDHVHRQGRVHRDVKPSNLMLAADGTVKLLDLGLARLGEMFPEQQLSNEERQEALAKADDQRQPGAGNPHTLTLTNQVMGTLEYMAPEQGNDPRNVDARADIYSLGCTLFKLLTGRAPYAEPRYSSSVNQIMAHIQAPVPAMRQELRPDAPAELAAIVQQMLAKQPSDRHQSAAEVAEALTPFAAGADLQRLIEDARPPRDQETQRPGPQTAAGRPLPPPVMAPTPGRTSPMVLTIVVVSLGLLMLLGVGVVLTGLRFTARPPAVPATRSIPIAMEDFAASDSTAPDDTLEEAVPAGQTVDLLAQVDVERDGLPGAWRAEDGAIVSQGGVARLQLPYVPPSDYQIRATVEQLSGRGGLNFGVVVRAGSNIRQCLAVVDGWPHEGYLSGPHVLDGQGLELHKSRARRGRMMPIGRPVELECTVRMLPQRAMLRVEADGREIFTWRGKPAQLSLEPQQRPPQADALFLSTGNSRIRITRLELVPLSSGGQVVEFADPQQEPVLAAAQRALWKGGRLTLAGDERSGSAWLEPQQIDRLADLPSSVPDSWRIEAIEARGSPWFSAHDVRDLFSVAGLKHLDLSGTAINGRQLSEWSGSPQLESLALNDADVRGWSPVGFPALRRLNIRGGLLNSTVLAHTDAWPQLQSLDLSYSSVDDSALAQLGGLNQLAELKLDYTVVSDEGLKSVAALPGLKSLSLMGTQTADTALAALAGLDQLQSLELLGTAVSDTGVAELRQQLPECRIDAGLDGSIDLMRLVQAEPGLLGSHWKLEDGRLVSDEARPTILPLLLCPPEQYDLEAVVRRRSHKLPLVFQLAVDNRAVMVGVDHHPDKGSYAILHGVDGRQEMESEVKQRGPVLPLDQEVKLVVQVRRGEINLLADGRPLLQWQGDFDRLQTHTYYATGQSNCLGLASFGSSFAVSHLQVKPLEGRADIVSQRPTPIDSDRPLIQPVFDKGAGLQITLDGLSEESLEPGGRLPERPFWVRTVRAVGGLTLTADDLDRLGRLSHLRQLLLTEAKFDAPQLQSLAALPELRVLHLQRTAVTDDNLSQLSELQNLTELELSGTSITGQGLRHLADLPGLTGLYLSQTNMNDDDLDAVAQLRALTSLSLSDTQVTGAGLARLQPLSSLQRLYLSRLQSITAESLAQLALLPELRVLHLDRAEIDDAACAGLAQIGGLRTLRLPNTNIGDNGAQMLAQLAELRNLNLHGTQVSDGGVPSLAQLPNLRRLVLAYAEGVTDASAGPLSRMSNLTELDLYGTQVSSDIVDQLRAVLPTASITASGWQAAPDSVPLPPEAGPPVDLLALVDLQRDAMRGAWRREGPAVRSIPDREAVLQFPYSPPPEYRVEAQVVVEGNEGPSLVVPVDGLQRRLHLDSWPHLGHLSGPHLIDGKTLNLHKDHAFRGRAIPRGQPADVAWTVRSLGDQALVKVEVDGREIFTWQGDARRLGATQTPGQQVLSLICFRTDVKFSKLQVTPLGMPGRVVQFADPDSQPDLAAAQRTLWKAGSVQAVIDGDTVELSSFTRLAKLTSAGGGGQRPLAEQPLPQSSTRSSVRSSIRSSARTGALAVFGEESPEQGLQVIALDSQRSPWFSPTDLAWCANLASLERLRISNVPLRQQDVAAMNNMRQLVELGLPWCEISTDAAAELGRLPTLRQLDLTGAQLDDKAAAAIAELSELEELNLSHAPLTDEGLRQLAGLQRLTRLNLDHTGVTSAGLGVLSDLADLQTLSLNGTPVNDDAVDTLAQLKQLDELLLVDTPLTDGGRRQLSERLGSTHVVGGAADPAIELLPLVDVDSPSTQGAWQRVGSHLRCSRSGPAFACIPFSPPEEYDMELVGSRLSGRDGIALLLIGGGRQFVVEWDHRQSITLVDMIDGKRFMENESAVPTGPTFGRGVETRVGVQVRRDRVRMLINGQVVVDWPADYSRLSLNWNWRQDNPEIMGVGAFGSDFEFRSLKLTPISGPLQTVKMRPTALTSERPLAEWTLQRGGEVAVTFDGLNQQTISAGQELPAGPLWVLELRGIRGSVLDEADFARFADTRRLDVLNIEHTLFDEQHLALLRDLQNLSALRLSGTPVGDEGLRHVANISSLKRLYLEGTGITDAGIQHLSRLKQLTEVSLHSTAVSDSAVALLADQLPELTNIDLAGTQVTGQSLTRLADLTQLVYLRLNDVRLNSSDLAPLIDLPNLHVLLLENTQLDDEAAELLAQMPELLDLRLANTGMSDAAVAPLTQLRQLRHLNLNGTQITDAATERLVRLRNLQQLSLSAEGITDASVAHLAGMTQLRDLDLRDTQISAEAVSRLAEALPQCVIHQPTRTLDLSDQAISDEQLAAAIANQSPQQLKLDNLGITDASMKLIADLAELRELSLENTLFTDEGLRHLAGMKQLETLNLNGTQVTDGGLARLEPLSSLRTLRLGRTAVTGQGLASLSMPDLRLIQLGSSPVNQTGFKQATRFKTLEHLDVAGAEIGDEDLAPLAELQQLKFLHLGFTNVRGPGLAHLTGLTQLQSLLLTRTTVDDAALQHVAALGSLHVLHLAHTAVTDEGLPRLEALSELQVLRLTGTKVSQAAMDRLLEKLPRLQIHFGPRVLRGAQSDAEQAEAPAHVPPQGARQVATGWSGSWSPDGKQLVYGRPLGAGVEVLDLESGQSRQLHPRGKDPRWSPDGRWVALVLEPRYNEYENEAIWLISPAGGKPRPLVRGTFPSWINQGRTLVCYSRDQQRLVAVDVDGETAETRPFFDAAPHPYCSVSPTGELIAYYQDSRLHVVDRQSGVELEAARRAALPAGFSSWSRDGRRLVVGTAGGQRAGVWLYDLDRNESKRLVAGPYVMPALSPDETRLVFDHRGAEERVRELWLVELPDAHAAAQGDQD